MREMDDMNIDISENWKRMLMVGAFAGAAYLLISGRRPAGFALAGIGMAVLAAEHPQRFEEIWNQAPHYLERGTKVVNQIGELVDKIAEQGSKFQQMRRDGGMRQQQSDYLT